MTPELSIVLPVHNEESTIGVLLEEIADIFQEKIRKYYEILVIDDASDDNSALVAQKASANLGLSRFFVNAVCLSQSVRSGQSAALMRGISAAKGELIITMDADLQHDPADIARLLEKIDKYDMVCGIRRKRNDGTARLLCSKIANAFRNWITGDSTIDSGCTFRIFRKECVPVILRLEGRLFGCELLFYPLFIRRSGFRVGQLSVAHRKRTSGSSNYRLIRGRLLRGIGASLKARKLLSSLEQ
jgi:dolichol-phosphate mannosyltransferase